MAKKATTKKKATAKKAAKKKTPATARRRPKTKALQVEWVDRSSIKPHADNPRHSSGAAEAVAESIRRFGWRQPIVVRRKTGEVEAGHRRLEAAELLGETKVPVVFVDDDDATAKAFMVADNRTGELATWDQKRLGQILAELESEEAGLEAVGFSDGDIEAFRRELEEAALQERRGEKTAPENEDPPANAPPENPVTVAGDVWALGEHRIICGDCREPEVFAELMEGDAVDLIITDPPYCSGGFQEAGKSAGTWGSIASDNLSSRGYQALLSGMVKASTPQALYLFYDWRMWTYVSDLVEGSGLPIRSVLVWDKGTPGLGAVWRTQHELVLFASRKNNKRRKGIPAYGNVLRSKRSGNLHHYTEKPVDLIEQIIRGDECTPRGKSVAIVDPFMGAGATLLACENMERTFRGIEIEPGYCDVSVERWQAQTGDHAVHVDTGETFNKRKAAR